MKYYQNKTYNELDGSINEYLIYLAHIQQSITLPIKGKIEAFHMAEYISTDINAITAKIMSKDINEFNEEGIKSFSEQQFRPIIKKINNEIHIYDKQLHINEKYYFSIKEAMSLLVNSQNQEIVLGQDKFNRLLSYKKLQFGKNEIEKEINIKKDLNETIKKYDKEFDGIKFKTFKELIRGVNHNNENFYFKINNYFIINYLENIQMTDSDQNFDVGIFFLVEKGKDIHILVKNSTVKIEYTINANTVNDISSISIIGYIVRDDSRVDFYIDESFPRSSMGSYLNAFNITQ